VRTLLRLLALGAGLGLFAWFVHDAGVVEIRGAFAPLGAGAILIVLPYCLVYSLDTLGWRFAFASMHHSRLSYAMQIKLRMAGEAINTLIPSAFIGGEPVKVYLAHKHGVPTVPAAQSVVVAKTTMTLAELVFIALAALAAAETLAPGSPVQRGMTIVTAVAAIIVALMFWLQSRGMFAGLVTIARKLHISLPALELNERHLRELDDTIIAFYRSDRARFFWSTAAHFGGWITGVIEVALGCWLLGHPIPWSQAFAIEAFTAIAKGLGAFAPGSIGVQESGIVFLFRIFGLPEGLGIAYAILRRGREIVFVALGSAFLFSEEASPSRLIERVRAETAELP
jgi:uncharacterized protein (TIRG00374 family)